MSIRFAKMDATLDSNPKVRRAGRNGREVFLFVLRCNANLDRGGSVPGSYVEPWYLAQQLMMTEAEASEGLESAINAGLLDRVQSVDGGSGSVDIAGWGSDWSKTPMTEARRKSEQRKSVRKGPVQKKSDQSDLPFISVTENASYCDTVRGGADLPKCPDMSGHDRDCPDSPTLEESRLDQISRSLFPTASSPISSCLVPTTEHTVESVLGSSAVASQQFSGGRMERGADESRTDEVKGNSRISPERTESLQPNEKQSPVSGEGNEFFERRKLGNETWDKLNLARSALALELGLSAPRVLHDQLPGRVALAERLRESGTSAGSDVDHVMAVATAEARNSGSLRYLSGSMFEPKSWAMKLAMSVDDASRGPRAFTSPGPERSNRNPTQNSLETLARLEREELHDRGAN